MTTPPPSPYLAEQLVGLNTRVNNLIAQRVTYIAGTVSSINLAASTFGADISQPDGTTATVTGIGSSPQFLPAVGNVVTLALSGAQIVYMPFGVAAASIDSPQLSAAVNTSISTASTNASSAVTTANAAQAAVGTKITTYYAGVAPTGAGLVTGDLWINTGSNNTLNRYNGSTWIQVQDSQIQSALTNAATAQATADGKIQTFFRTTAPVNPADNIGVGDFWIDTANGNRLNRWSGTAWVNVQDTAIQSALTAAAAAQATANTKVLVFAQPTQPTAQEPGDVWFDTDNGNKMFIWGPTPTVTRINYALNPSFEADTAGTHTTISSWTNYTSGTTGTVTRSIVTTGGVTSGTKAAKIVMAAPVIAVGTGAGIQQSYVAAQNDVWRISCTVQLSVTDTNKPPFMLVEWLNGSGAVISSGNTSGSGTLTTSQTLTFTSPSLPSLTASIRVTLFRRSTGAGSTGVNTDLVIDAVLAEKNRDTAAPTTYFDGDNPSSTDSVWGNPDQAPNAISTWWGPGVTGVNAWQPQQLRSGALMPQSILGNDCIAYGSITAPLLEALLVLAGTVVAGDPNADHAALMTDGLHLFRTITGEGLQEVGTLAVGSVGTRLAFVDSTGKQVAQIDEGGNASVTSLNVDTDPIFQGTALSTSLFQKGGAMVASSYNSSFSASGITTEVGLGEISFIQDNSRSYWVKFHPPHVFSTTAGTDAQLTLRYTTDGTSPTVTSTSLDSVLFTIVNGSSYTYSPPDIDAYGNFPGVNGAKIRILASCASIAGGSVNMSCGSGAFLRPFRMWVADMGPNIPDTYLANSGAGGVTSKTSYSTGNISSSGHWSYQGGGGLRSDTTDVVQGTDPSGFNGDGKGGWNFTIPNITTGAIQGINLFIYSNFTYYNSGAHILVYPVVTANTPTPTALQSVYDPGILFPKPGGISFALPSSWFSSFTGKTSIGIYIGPSSLVSGAGNELYYLRADGPSALLAIRYTQ